MANWCVGTEEAWDFTKQLCYHGEQASGPFALVQLQKREYLKGISFKDNSDLQFLLLWIHVQLPADLGSSAGRNTSSYTHGLGLYGLYGSLPMTPLSLAIEWH